MAFINHPTLGRIEVSLEELHQLAGQETPPPVTQVRKRRIPKRMTEFQRRTLEVIQGFPEGIHVSDIAELTGMSVSQVQSAVQQVHLKGFTERVRKGTYRPR